MQGLAKSCTINASSDRESAVSTADGWSAVDRAPWGDVSMAAAPGLGTDRTTS